MHLFFSFLLICCFPVLVVANRVDTIPSKYDSSLWQLLVSQESLESNAILMNEQERTTGPATVSPLYGEKDVFLQMAAFQFSAMRFRYRGYDASFSGTLINGLLLNDQLQGNPGWSLWSGLSPVMRSSIDITSTRFQDNWMGDPGISTSTDMRAVAQRRQLQWGYGISNRTYTNRYSISYATESNQRGWSWAVAANFRLATEGYRTGCAYASASYYLAIDKQFRKAGLLSLILFGAPQQYGKQAAITAPVSDLLGSHYNPHWGYQQGRKRNAALTYQHMPVLIVSHEWNPDNQSAWISSLGWIRGKRADTGLDWYNAADPRPDYYRYLPAYQTDTILSARVADALSTNERLRQIDWQQLYTINRHSIERVDNVNGTGESITGKRTHYLLEQRITQTQRVLFSSYYKARWNGGWNMAAGIQFSYQRNHHYKTVYDLLGADFHVNWNQFAENDFPSDQQAIQFNIDQPNQLLQKGDKYGYNYLASVFISNIWVQAERTGRKLDYLFGIRFSKTQFNRTGLVRNGLFPHHSKGSAVVNHFFDPAFKAAMTYKVNGHHMLSFLVQVQSKAPLFDNVYISPRMRSTRQDWLVSESITGAEINYRFLWRKLKGRISLYHTQSDNGMNVLTFYHDGYRNFVNYAMRNIDRQYTGIESGMSYTFSERWECSLAFAKSIHRYTSRQAVTVSLDNNEALLDKMEVYSNNFRVAGSPQQVLGFGVQYRTPKSLFLQLNSNFFDQQWLDFNPLRRTYQALEGVQKGSELWRRIIDQTRLPSIMLINIFLGKGFSIRNVANKKPLRFFCTAAVNNLMNQQQIITGGYEQLRFDQDTKDPDRFPPKLFYGYGINYSFSVSISF